jgi:hypothetical protein
MKTTLKALASTCGAVIALLSLAACGGGYGGVGGSTMYTVGGTVTGLSGSGLTIRNGTTDLPITGSPFTFPASLANGTRYDIAVIALPSAPAQVCSVSNGSGTINGSNVTNVAITCTTTMSLSDSTPATGAASVQRTVAPVLNFSASLDVQTATPGTVSLTSPTGSQAITVNVTGNRLTVTPATDLSSQVLYTLTIGTGLRGSAGEQLVEPVLVRFTTGKSWGTPRRVDAGDEEERFPHVAIDANGNILAAWSQPGGLWSSRYTAGNGWGTPQIIAPSKFGLVPFDSQITFDAQGNALTIWEQPDVSGSEVIWSNRYTADAAAGSWGIAQPIETESPGQLIFAQGGEQFGFDASGNALVVWDEFDSTNFINIKSKRYTAGTGVDSGWDSTAKLVETDNVHDAFMPRVAVDAAGGALAVWAQGGGSDGLIKLQSSRYTPGPGGGWDAARLIEIDDPGEPQDPQIALDGNGGAWAVWHQYDPLQPQNFSVWSSRYAAGTGWATAERISNGDGDAQLVQIASDGHANALAVWVQSGDTGHSSISSSRYTAGAGGGSGWGASQQFVTGDAGDASDPQLAFDAHGNAFLVWAQFDGPLLHIWSSHYSAGGWDAVKLIGTDDAVVGGFPQIVVDANGNAVVVWHKSDGDAIHIWSNRFE